MTKKAAPRRRRGIRSWLIAILLAGTLLAVATVLLTPRLINLETVRHAVEKKISEQVGGRISLGKLGLAYLPRPHAVIRKVRLAVSDVRK